MATLERALVMYSSVSVTLMHNAEDFSNEIYSHSMRYQYLCMIVYTHLNMHNEYLHSEYLNEIFPVEYA